MSDFWWFLYMPTGVFTWALLFTFSRKHPELSGRYTAQTMLFASFICGVLWPSLWAFIAGRIVSGIFAAWREEGQ